MQFKLTKRGFVDGALREPGYITNLAKGTTPGSMEPVDDEAKAYVASLAKGSSAPASLGGDIAVRAGHVASELEGRFNAMSEENERLAALLSSAQVENTTLQARVAKLEAEVAKGKGATSDAQPPAAAGGPKPAAGNGGSAKGGKAG